MTTPSASPGFKVPFNIPGAPERVTVSELVDTAKPLVQTSLDSWQRKPGSFETALSQATWWHFWVLVGISVVVSAICSTVNLLIVDSQFRFLTGYSRGILGTLIYLILAVPVGLLIFYFSVYASHWWATKQAGGTATLIQHSYVIGVIWAGEVLITSVLGVLFTLIGLGLLWSLASLAIAIYALYLIGGNIRSLYQFQDGNQVWITAAVMVIASFVASLVLLGVLAAIAR
jgi:hypothetical protein